MRRHDPPIGAGVGDEDDIALLAGGQEAALPEHIARFADWTDDPVVLISLILQSAEIDNVVVGSVERRPDQRIHPGADAEVVVLPLAFQLGHAGQQDAALRGEITARLEPDFHLTPGQRFGQQFVQTAQIEARLAASVRHAETTTQVKYPHIRKLRQYIQKSIELLAPHARIADPTAGVGVESHNPPTMRLDGTPDRRQMRQGNPELGVHPRRDDLLVMSVPCLQIEPQEDVSAGEHLRPLVDGPGVVHGQPHTQFHRLRIFPARGKIRREQNITGLQAGYGVQHMLDFRERDTLEPHPFCSQRPQQVDVVVGLDCV